MPDDIKLPDVMSMVRALEHTQKPARPVALEMIQKCIESYARAAVLADRARQYPLPDELYPDSKDWLAGGYAARVKWLHVMYEAKAQEVEMWVEIAGSKRQVPLTDEQVLAALASITNEPPRRLPPGWKWFARAIERAHGIPAPKGGSES